MQEQHYHWHSDRLGQSLEMLSFGHAGWPLILFPTSQGRYFQNKDFGLIGSIQGFIDAGKVKVYCPDAIDGQSWYNRGIHPAERVRAHMAYDDWLRNELLPLAEGETGYGKAAVGGASFGAYHATNFAFRYPEKVGYLFNMGGAYDIASQLDGYFDENAYYHNPLSFIRDLAHPDLWQMGIVLGIGEYDFCRPANEELHHILKGKGVESWLDIVPGMDHDWDAWMQMLPRYVAEMR